MSLHIESTENALAELKKQRTKTLTAAISVSFLGIALMGLLLYLVHIIVAVPEDPPMVAYATQEGDNPDIDTPEVTQTTQRPSSSSTSAQVTVIAAVATADVAVVNPDIEVDVPSEELSMGIDIGDGFGTGTGDGDGGGIPGIISKRCDLNDRMKRITENGGTPQCEEAVVKSLRWLKKQQNKDGSWGGAPHNYKCAMTGMALLSYLAHCETPLSEEFGETVLKGISFLVDQGMKNPVLSLVPQRNEVSYDHAVATYALCEAYTFCKQMDIPSISNLEKVVIKAVDKIVDNQNTNGGWAYNTKAGAHTDLSVTGWNVQALKAAEHGGIRPSKRRNTHGPAQSRGLLPEMRQARRPLHLHAERQGRCRSTSLPGGRRRSFPSNVRQRFGQRRPQGTGLDAQEHQPAVQLEGEQYFLQPLPALLRGTGRHEPRRGCMESVQQGLP